MTAARMRTLDSAIAQLKVDDPGTSFTKHALRQKVLNGEIPHVRCGNKILVNYDLAVKILADGNTTQPESQPGMIRRLP